MEAKEQNPELEEVILRGSDENRFSIINVQDVPANYSRTISRLPTLLEEQEWDQEQDSEQDLRGHPEMEEESEEQEQERDRELEVHLELLRNSWTLSPANSSRVWLLGTGNTS